MNKKTHIKVKRGLVSKEHYLSMGNRIWLFLYILDNTDWKTGTVENYTDQEAADQLGAKIRTVRDWRQGLESDGYIACKQGLHCQKIYVNNWSNPRDKWDEEQQPKEPQDEDTTQYRKLSVAFVNRSKVPELSGGVKRWNEGLQKLVSAGVEVQDVESAVDILREKDFTINSISSIVNTAISEMAKRKSGKNGHKQKSSNPLFQNQHNDNTDAEKVLAQLEEFEKGLSL